MTHSVTVSRLAPCIKIQLCRDAINYSYIFGVLFSSIATRPYSSRCRTPVEIVTASYPKPSQPPYALPSPMLTFPVSHKIIFHSSVCAYGFCVYTDPPWEHSRGAVRRVIPYLLLSISSLYALLIFVTRECKKLVSGCITTSCDLFTMGCLSHSFQVVQIQDAQPILVNNFRMISQDSKPWLNLSFKLPVCTYFN